MQGLTFEPRTSHLFTLRGEFIANKLFDKNVQIIIGNIIWKISSKKDTNMKNVTTFAKTRVILSSFLLTNSILQF